MSKEKMDLAFSKFEDEKFADSEDIIRGVIKKAVNNHLKDKLGLKKDPISLPEEE